MGGALSVALEGHLDLQAFTVAQLNNELLKAAKKGNAESVRSILAFDNVDPNCRDEYRDTPLILAARLGHLEVVRALLSDARVKINEQGRYNRTALIWAAIWGKRTQTHDTIASLLLEKEEILIDTQDVDGNTAFMHTVYRENINVFKQLCLKNPNVNITNRNGDCAFTWAANCRDFYYIYTLSLKKPQLDFTNEKTKKRFIWLVYYGNSKIVPYLFSAAKIDEQNVDFEDYLTVKQELLKYRKKREEIKKNILIFATKYLARLVENDHNFQLSPEFQEQLYKALVSDLKLCPQWYHCRLEEDLPTIVKNSTVPSLSDAVLANQRNILNFSGRRAWEEQKTKSTVGVPYSIQMDEIGERTRLLSLSPKGTSKL